MRFRIIGIICWLGILACSPRLGSNLQDKLSFERIRDITIHTSNNSPIGPCEPSISINHINPLQIVAGSVLDNVYLSGDGGLTWKIDRLKSSHSVFGDPVVRHDQKGNPLYFHLSNSKNKAYNSKEFLDRIVAQKSYDGGITWTDGSYPKVDHNKDHDKHWVYVDPITGHILLTWTEFDKYASTEPQDKSRILFSKSIDDGESWTDAISISEFEGDCIDGDMTTEGAHPCVGVDGTYYVVWGFNEKLYLDYSKDRGETWQKKDVVVADQLGGWAFDIAGIGRCNGMPIMMCDHSNGPNRGTLYINWSDQSNGKNDTDVWLISSKNNGKTWSNKVKVNNDKGSTHQFFTWMDLDQKTGNLYSVFYDRRQHLDTKTDVYLAYSVDGGKKFENIKISKESFLPSNDVFFGDYNDISAIDGVIRPIWTSLSDGKLSVHTAIINVKK
jgi:hypothetical protein